MNTRNPLWVGRGSRDRSKPLSHGPLAAVLYAGTVLLPFSILTLDAQIAGQSDRISTIAREYVEAHVSAEDADARQKQMLGDLIPPLRAAYAQACADVLQRKLSEPMFLKSEVSRYLVERLNTRDAESLARATRMARWFKQNPNATDEGAERFIRTLFPKTWSVSQIERAMTDEADRNVKLLEASISDAKRVQDHYCTGAAAPTVLSIPTWTDSATGEPIHVSDPWDEQNRSALKSRTPEVDTILKLAAPVVRDEFEKTADFELRLKKQEMALREFFRATPVLLPANRELKYDADAEVMKAELIVATSADSEYDVPDDAIELLTAFAPLVLRIPSAEIVQSVRASLNRGISPRDKRYNDPISFRNAMGQIEFSCEFPLRPDEAKTRKPHLSILYNVRVDDTSQATGRHEVTGTLPSGRVVRVNRRERLTVLEAPPSQIEVWLVDRLNRQRLGQLTLARCLGLGG